MSVMKLSATKWYVTSQCHVFFDAALHHTLDDTQKIVFKIVLTNAVNSIVIVVAVVIITSILTINC